MAELDKLLTQFNLKIFELLIDGTLSVRDLAKKVNCSPAKITQFSKLFKKSDLITLKKEKNRKLLVLNKENPLVREIITLLFINKITASKVFSELKKKAKSIGVYGSIVEGNLDKNSDIDLWVLTKKRVPLVESGLTRIEMSKELGKEVSIRFLIDEDLEKLKKKDSIFYNELEYKSRILFGKGF